MKRQDATVAVASAISSHGQVVTLMTIRLALSRPPALCSARTRAGAVDLSQLKFPSQRDTTPIIAQAARVGKSYATGTTRDDRNDRESEISYQVKVPAPMFQAEWRRLQIAPPLWERMVAMIL